MRLVSLLVWIGAFSMVCNCFQWKKMLRLKSSLFVKPEVGQLVEAKLNRICGTASNLMAEFTTDHGGEIHSASMPMNNLTICDKIRLDVGSTINLIVTNNEGAKLQVDFPSPRNYSINYYQYTEKDQLDLFEELYAELQQKTSKVLNVSTFLSSDLIKSYDDYIDKESINIIFTQLNLTSNSRFTFARYLDFNKLVQKQVYAAKYEQEFLSLSTDNGTSILVQDFIQTSRISKALNDFTILEGDLDDMIDKVRSTWEGILKYPQYILLNEYIEDYLEKNYGTYVKDELLLELPNIRKMVAEKKAKQKPKTRSISSTALNRTTVIEDVTLPPKIISPGIKLADRLYKKLLKKWSPRRRRLRKKK